MDLGPGIPAQPGSDPEAFNVNGESYARQFKQRWQGRLPMLANAGVPLDQIRPIFAYDYRRVTSGREPLSDREAAMGIRSVLTGEQQVAAPEDTGISGVLSAPLEDLRNIVTSLPQMPAAMVREAGELPQAAEKFSQAIATPGLSEKAQAIGQVPGLRMVPGVFTATNLAQGPEGWATLAKHPFTTALDVLPWATELGLTAKIGKAAEPLVEKYNTWSGEKGFGGPGARGTSSMSNKAARQASIEFDPLRQQIDDLAGASTEEERVQAAQALQHAMKANEARGIALTEDQAARLNAIFGDGTAVAGDFSAQGIPQVPDAAQPLVDYQRNVMNPQTEDRLIQSDQATRVGKIPNVARSIYEELGPEYLDEVLSLDDRNTKILIGQGANADALAGKVSSAENKWAHAVGKAQEAEKAWEDIRGQHEFAGYDTDTDAVIGNLREHLGNWINEATPIMDAEARSSGLTEFVAKDRPWPKSVPKLRPGEEAYLAGQVTPGRVETLMDVDRVAKARPNPKLSAEEQVVRRVREVTGIHGPYGYEQYSGKLLRLQDEVSKLRSGRDAALGPLETVKASPQYERLTGPEGVLASLDEQVLNARPDRVLSRLHDEAKASGADFPVKTLEELNAYRESLQRQQLQLAMDRASLKDAIDANGGVVPPELRDQALSLKRLEEATKSGRATYQRIFKEIEDAQARGEAAAAQKAKLEAENPLLKQVREHEALVAEKFGKPLEEAEAALEAERRRVARAKPDLINEKMSLDPREHRLSELYRLLDDHDAGVRVLPDEAYQAATAEVGKLENEGVSVPPSDRKMAAYSREPKFEAVGQKRYDAREKLYYQLLGDQRGTPGLIEEAANALRGDDIPLARRKLAAARRLAAKAGETWPEFTQIADEMDTVLDYYHKATATSGYPKYLRQKAHYEQRIADAWDKAHIAQGRLSEMNERAGQLRQRMVSTLKKAPPARFTPLLTEVMRFHQVGKVGAAEAMATLEGAMDEATRTAVAQATGKTDPAGLVYDTDAIRAGLSKDQAALFDEYLRVHDIYKAPFRANDLRRAVRELYGIEHPAIEVLAKADDATLDLINEYKTTVVDKNWPEELVGRKASSARAAATEDMVAALDSALGLKDSKLVRDFFDSGADLPPGDYILPSDKGVIESLQVGAFDKLIDANTANLIKGQITRTWTTMRDVYGFEPVFVHHVRPGAVERVAMANVNPDRVSKPTQAKVRSIFGAPYESDLSVALKHQGMEWIQREWQINSLWGYHDGHIYTPGILSSATGSYGTVEGSLAEASGHGRGFGYQFHELVEAHMPEINARADRVGIAVPPADVVDLQSWINTPDAEVYRGIASEYLNKRYSRLAPFDLMNWKSGGMASRRVGDMREIVRFADDGPWRMMVPEEVYVPKAVNKVLESLMNEKKGPSALYSVYDKSLDVFRVSALAFSPRFHFYNVIGGGLLALIRTGPSIIGDLGEAARMAGDIKGLTRDMPAGMSLGGVYADSTVTRMADALRTPLPGTGKIDAWLSRRLNFEAGKTLGGLWNKVKGGAEWSFALNEWVDNVYRSAVYLYGKRQAASRLGVSEAELLDTIRKGGADLEDIHRNWANEDMSSLPAAQAQALLQYDEVQRAGISLSNKILQDWDSMLPWERHVLRNVVPFYGWMRHIAKYTLTLPIDHPWRAAMLTTYSRIEDQDRADPLGDRFQSIFWLGKPGDDGRQLTVNTAGLNPFQSFGDMFTFAGFMSQLSPIFQAGLEMAGVDMVTASSQLYPEMTYDPESGKLVAVRKSPVEALAGAFVPQTEGLAGAAGFSKDMRRLAATDPEAWRSRILVSLGVPLSPRFRSKDEEMVKAEVARGKAATDAVSRAVRTGEWAEADRYKNAVLSDSSDKPHMVDVAALKQALLDRQAAQAAPAGQ